jgi:hypothetical protein
LASKIAAVVSDYVKQEIPRPITWGEADDVVLSAALFLAIDAVANIKCRDCRRMARKRVEKAIPEVLRGD